MQIATLIFDELRLQDGSELFISARHDVKLAFMSRTKSITTMSAFSVDKNDFGGYELMMQSRSLGVVSAGVRRRRLAGKLSSFSPSVSAVY